ncbi:hypothetical protein HYDPIDRAFT_31682, partial [Hydnomerulius pinastri MD-312]
MVAHPSLPSQLSTFNKMSGNTFARTCVCGREFSSLGAFTLHEKGCQKDKKRLSSALAKAKEVYQAKKARLQAPSLHQDRAGPTSLESASDAAEGLEEQPASVLQPAPPPPPDGPSDNNELPLAQRRTQRTNRRLPLRFRDLLPEPPLPLPPPDAFSEPPVAPDPRADNSSSPSESPLSDGAGSILSLFRKIFKTQLNKFSLFRVYNTNQLPSHDPDDPYSVDNINVPTPEHSDDTRDSNDTRNLYHPYPNKSAMLLGDWYWNEGTQKTQEGFKQLL